jgi:hypothetical protein
MLLFNTRLHLVQEENPVPFRRCTSLLHLHGLDLLWRAPLTEEEDQRSVRRLDRASA